MAGVADRAMRELCVSYGASYVIGEMASSKGISMHDRKSASLLSISPQERPAGVQLFGDDPLTMAKAAEMAMDYAPDFLDINMGCPAPKVAGNGGGSALMKKPQLAAEIVRACVHAVPVPVTVKMRIGWDDETRNATELAKLCADAGAAAITVHGRTRAQMYAPPVYLDEIRRVKQAVDVPVIGNGDVTDGESAKRMLDETGCDFLMVGRGALGRPWVFQQVNAWLDHTAPLPEPPVARRNSEKLMGPIWRKVTFPTGNEPSSRARATPRSEPAQATCCSGSSSAKYLRAPSAAGQSWISSRTISVLVGSMSQPSARPRLRTMRRGSWVRSKSWAYSLGTPGAMFSRET